MPLQSRRCGLAPPGPRVPRANVAAGRLPLTRRLLLGLAVAAAPACRGIDSLVFTPPAWSARARVGRWSASFVAARRQGGARTSSAFEVGPLKRRGTSTVALPAGKPSAVRFFSTAGKVCIGGLGAVTGLVALLYVTSCFEACMNLAAGFVSGTSALGAGAIGLAVGMLHTVAGPDHLAGLAPLVVGQRRSPLAAFGLGALWGSGHATGQLILGAACLLVHFGVLRLAWADAFTQVSTILIGASLIAIGLLGARETCKYKESESHEHVVRGNRFGWATYATGVLHGLSLDAILFITPALALPRLAAALHVVGVATGTLISMGCYTALLSRLCRQSPRLQLVSGGASALAILLGVCILAASFGLTLHLPGF